VTQKHVVGTVDELEYDGRIQVELPDGEEILLIKRNDGVVALQALCPHQYAPLIGGEIDDDGCLECPLHGWRFSLATGVDPENAYVAVQTYKCGIDGDKLWVGDPIPVPSPV
jgi:nitrite reductase/ring-hydroxylating ferredoxin subunit